MKRALIITYYWPPSGGSGVQRWVKFSKYLPQNGWQPVIYTPENPSAPAQDTTLLKDIPAGAEVIKTPISEPYAIYARLFGKKKGSGSGSGEVNPINAQKKSLKQKLSLFVRSNFFIPDPRVWWVKPSVKFLCDYLKDNPVDVIITTGPPHSMHLIGREVHRATGIKWVADFRDPWTKMFYFKNLELLPFASRKHHRLEKSVLDEADAIISVSPLVRDDFVQMTTTPVHLVTNGFDPEDYSAVVPAEHEGVFRVVHTGLFASDGNPLVLWDALARKCEADPAFASALQIRLAGKTDKEIISAIEAAGLGRNLVNLGYCDHTLAVEEQVSADLLLLPLRQDPEYRKVLPGKIFECVASGRPVLGIGQEDGAAAQILAESGAGVMCDWTASASIASVIDQAWDSFCGRPDSSSHSRLDPSCHSRPVRASHSRLVRESPYARTSLTETLARLLDELATSRS